MPGKKRYNVRFPPARVKKIMQKDIEVGKMATAVPVIISRAIEMFLKSLLTKTCLITQSKRTKVMSVTHMKQCIESEKLFDFLKVIAESAPTVPNNKEAKVKRKWPLYRNIRPYSLQRNAKQKEAEEILKTPCNVSLDCKNKLPECSLPTNAKLIEVEDMAKNHSNVSLSNHASSSDSDSPLYICL